MLSRNFRGGAHRGAADEGAKVVIADMYAIAEQKTASDIEQKSPGSFLAC